jgi:hypothetical protein
VRVIIAIGKRTSNENSNAGQFKHPGAERKRRVLTDMLVLICAFSKSKQSLTFCGTRPENQEPMKKYILCLLGAVVAMAFIASCQQQGTTATTTAPAAAKASPTPTKSHVKTSSGHLYRNPAPSPTP